MFKHNYHEPKFWFSMSAPDQIHLDLHQTDGHYAAGAPLSGDIRLDLSEPLLCERLLLQCGWQTRGRGERDAHFPISKTLFADVQLEPGNHSYSFQFQLPQGPCSYSGEDLEVCWTIEASLALPSGANRSTREPITIDPARGITDNAYEIGSGSLEVDDTSFDWEPATASNATTTEDHAALTPEEREDADRSSDVFWTFGAGTLWGGFAVVFGVTAMDVMDRDGFTLEACGHASGSLILGMMAGLALWGGYNKFLRNRRAERRLGDDLEIELPSRHTHAGSTIGLVARFSPTSEITFEQITLRLRAVERTVQRGIYGDEQPENQTLRKIDDALAHLDSPADKNRPFPSQLNVATETMCVEGSQNLTVVPGQTVEITEAIDLPPDAPPSFKAPHNQLHWFVDVTIAIEQQPDWRDSFPINVYPRVVASTDDTPSDGKTERAPESTTPSTW